MKRSVDFILLVGIAAGVVQASLSGNVTAAFWAVVALLLVIADEAAKGFFEDRDRAGWEAGIRIVSGAAMFVAIASFAARVVVEVLK